MGDDEFSEGRGVILCSGTSQFGGVDSYSEVSLYIMYHYIVWVMMSSVRVEGSF